MRWTLTLLLVACAGNTPSADEATVSILAPTEGEVVTGSTLLVSLEVTDFTFTSVASRTRTPGPLDRWLTTAHAHEIGEAPNGYAAVQIDGEQVATLIESTGSLPVGELAPGTHTLRVVLSYPDGDLLFPAVADDVSFERP